MGRAEYITRARIFCLGYFRDKYGDDWAKLFFSYLPLEVKQLRYGGWSNELDKTIKHCKKCKTICIEHELGRIICLKCKKRY